MDVRCERCRAQYVFDDDQVTSAGLTVQCTNCGHIFKVRKKELVVTVPVKEGELQEAPLPADAATPRRPPAHAAAPPTRGGTLHGFPPHAHEAEPERPREWRLRQSSGNVFTFRELTTLQKWIIEQKVSRDDEISAQGDQWKRLGNIPELASFFQVVEAAERSKILPIPAVTPMPAVTPLPLPMPVYGVAIQPAVYPAPTFPPPGAAPPPPPASPSGDWGPVAPVLPPPVHEVDLGTAEMPLPPRRRSRWWIGVLVLLVGAGGAVGVYLAVPGLFSQAPPAPPPKNEVEVPITIEVKPAEPPATAWVPAEPEVKAPPPAAPEPVAQPEPEKPAPPKGPKAILARAKALLEKGDAEKALELFGKVASQDPSNVEALTGRGLCYLDLENYAPAEASFQAALQIEPGDPDAMLGLAESYRFQGKKAEAISQYEAYLARHPGGDDAEVARHALEELRK